MPELPDVEVFRRYLAATSMQQRVAQVHVAARALLRQTSPQGLGRMLKGRRFVDTRRHGKHLFAALDSGKWLRMHFGMTGYLDYAEETEAPRHTGLRIDFCNGARLAYVAQRKLGELQVVEDVDAYIGAAKLGPDALALDAEALRELLRSRRGMLKSFLMNQQVLAGLGNVYSDEILYQAKIHPQTRLDELSEQQLDALDRALHAVLEGAIDAGAEVSRMPDSWLLPKREHGGRCPHCGGEIRRMHAAGRTAYYCPGCQPRAG